MPHHQGFSRGVVPGWALFLLGTVILCVLAIASVGTGSVTIDPETVIGALGRAIGLGNPDQAGGLDRIVTDLRLPRTVIAVMVGAGLGIIGCLLQTVTRNDLADPFLFGLSSGAAAGAVLVITVTGDRFGFWTLPAAAFCGGMLASGIAVLLIRRLGGKGPETLILAGLAVSFLFVAVTNFMIFQGDQRAAHSILFWTLGGLGNARWEIVPLVSIGFVTVLGFALHKRRALDALLAGDLTAMSLGVRVERLRIQVFLVSAFGAAVFVSITGVIGFIGLMVPHLARGIAGPLHLGVILWSALIGAMLLTGSDIAARVLLAPQELPIGIVTSSFGAVFVIVLLANARR